MTTKTEQTTACSHAGEIQQVTPNSPNSCRQCAAAGDSWVSLRVCLGCGEVGCCDSSKNQHATAHWKATGHPIIQSYMPGEAWRWCFSHAQPLPDGTPFRR